MRLWKTKHPWKHFQNFCQSDVLLTDQIEIHQLQPLVWPSNLLYVMLLGCDWWISIRSVKNTQDWWKFWKHFRRCFVLEICVSTKMAVSHLCSIFSGTDDQWGSISSAGVEECIHLIPKVAAILVFFLFACKLAFVASFQRKYSFGIWV